MKLAAALILLGLAVGLNASLATAQDEHAQHSRNSPESMAMNHDNQIPMGPKDCTDSEVWDYSFGSCQPLNMGKAPMKMGLNIVAHTAVIPWSGRVFIQISGMRNL